MSMLTEPLDAVIGVDTHKHTHTAAAVAPSGAVLEHLTVAADPKGYRRLVVFGRRHGATLWAIEGTGSFGAGLTTMLVASGERVVEVERPQRSVRRAGVKNDDVDAVRAARQALAGIGISEPRRRGEREAIRVLLTTRAQAIEFRTRAIAALHALVVSAPDKLRERLRSLPLGQLLHTCAGTVALSPRTNAWMVARVGLGDVFGPKCDVLFRSRPDRADMEAQGVSLLR
jgi:transposase